MKAHDDKNLLLLKECLQKEVMMNAKPFSCPASFTKPSNAQSDATLSGGASLPTGIRIKQAF